MLRPKAVTSLPQDLSVVFRRLRAAPGVSLLVVGTLGLVLGANTLTFSLVNEVVLNPLPAIADKDGLVNVHRWRNEKDGLLGFSHPAYLALAESDLFEGGLVAFNGRGLSLERRSGPEFVFGMLASANYFEALGVRPRLGRAFDARDNRPDLLAFDAPAFLISALVMLVTTMVAIIGPAWRASRIAPQVALRSN